MTAYLVLVLLLAPAADGGAPLQTELHQSLASASSDEVCQQHADRLAAEQLRRHAETVRKLRGRVVGQCRRIGSMT
jgi:hypothetical protein